MERTRAASRTPVHLPPSTTMAAVMVSSAITTPNAYQIPANSVNVPRTDALTRFSLSATDVTVKYALTASSAMGFATGDFARHSSFAPLEY